MLNLKKVIALVCVFAMVLTTVAFGATYSDVAEDSAYYEAVETLNKLDIVTGYEDGTFKPEDGVTRAEMAALIARIQGYGETAKGSANTGFTDVPATHWASGYIANAAGMGIINGYGDGTFGPDDAVLYEQAVKMVMATLGYTPFAEKNGGYPTGYLAAAQRYDVSLAVANAAVGSEANRGTVAQILANALDTPLMVQSKWNTNGEVDYVIADGKGDTDYKTLMSENLGYVKIRGIVTETPYSTLTAAQSIDTTADAKVAITVVDAYDTNNKDFIDASGNIVAPADYLVGETDAADYLGRSVIAYVKKVNNEYELVSIAVDTVRNDELVIGLDQYNAGGSVGTNLTYYKEGANETTEAVIGSSFAVVLNGQGQSTANLATLLSGKDAFGGQITLIDNNDTKGYDVAIVDIAYTAVIDEVTDKRILTKAGVLGDIRYDLEDETKVIAVYKDGAEIAPTDLVEWDVVSIYANNKNDNYIVINVLGSSVVGTISSKKISTTSKTGSAYKIADNWYDVADGAYKCSASDLGVGEGGTFYIDEFGKIAAFVEDAALAGGTTTKYAYIIGTAAEEADFGGAGFGVKLQMVTAEGVVIADLKSNARIETLVSTTPTTLNLDLTTWNDNDNDGIFESGETGYADFQKIDALKTKVVQYVTNSAGQITKITAPGFDGDFAVAGSFSANAVFDADRSRFGAQKVDKDAIVFVTAADPEDYVVTTLAAFSNDDTYTITTGYADKKADDVNVIVVAKSELSRITSANVAVVTEVGEGTDEATGETIWTISYFINGEEVTADTDADVATGTQPTKGDIIKVAVVDGVITNIDFVWNFAPVIRDNYRNIANNADVDITTTTNATATANGGTGYIVDAGLEKFFGGIVTAANEDYEVTLPGIVSGSKQIYLDEAENVYVIEVGQKNTVIDTGSYRDFGYFEKLYDGTADTLYSVVKGDTHTTTAGAEKAYADHVYVREYDGDIIDVIIVKGLVDDVE